MDGMFRQPSVLNEQLNRIDSIQSHRVVTVNVPLSHPVRQSRKTNSACRPAYTNTNCHRYSSSLPSLSVSHQWLFPVDAAGVLIACCVRICNRCGAFNASRPGLTCPPCPPLSWIVSPSSAITFPLDWITRQMSRVRSQQVSVWYIVSSVHGHKGQFLSCWRSITWNQKLKVHV